MATYKSSIMVIIGRDNEKKILHRAILSNKSELIAVYGRRRVGKTYLIRNYYADKILFEFSGSYNGKLKDQLENFHLVLAEKRKGFPQPDSWRKAFFQLGKYINSFRSTHKKVIFLDEFPWLASRKSGFLSAFDYFWNTYCTKRTDLVVVICGSAASYMVKKILKSKSGLHNRVTEVIRLLPFNLFETALFLKVKGILYSRYDIIQVYMAMGGVPHYLDKLQKGESVAQALDRLCFEKDAPLQREFDQIFAALFENHERHEAIIRVLSTSRSGINRNTIAKRTGIPSGGRLTQTLNELEASGFIEMYTGLKNKKKGAMYRLIDEYSLFYLEFIEPARSSGPGTWLKLSNRQSFKVWAGFTFETLCLKHVEQIKFSLGIAGVYTRQAGWREKDGENKAQVDLVIDRDDNVINLCETKFYIGTYTLSRKEAENIRNKIQAFKESTKTKKIVFFTMITTYGMHENQWYSELVQNELTMDELFVF